MLTFTPLVLRGQPSQPMPSLAPAATQPPPPAKAPVAPSSLLQPALVLVGDTLNSLKFEKWKKGSVRDEASENVDAILRDLKTKVPPLMADADSTPSAVSKSIPLMKHLDAVYDVLLRVEEGARVSAPGDQVDQLVRALKKFESARIALYDSLQESAAGQEKQVGSLQAALKAQQAKAAEPKPAPTPAPVPCAPPKPTAKRKHTTPAKGTQSAPAQPNTQNPQAQPKQQ